MLHLLAIRPGEALLVFSSTPLGRYSAWGTQPWSRMGEVRTQAAEQDSLARPEGPIQIIAVSEEQSRTLLALRHKTRIKHSDRVSYIIRGTQHKMKMQGSLFKKPEKNAIKGSKI